MVAISGDIALASVTSVATLFLLVCVGVTASQWPGPTGKHERGLLSVSVVRKLAGLYILVIEPCLTITSIGSRMTLDTFKGVWPMMLWGIINPIVGLVLTWLTMFLARPPKKLRRVYLANGMFANVLGVPLVLLETLCTQKTLEGEAECFERAASFAFIHTFGFGIVFWTIGYSILMGSDEDAKSSSVFHWVKKHVAVLINPPFIAMMIGLIIALSGGQSIFFGADAPLLFLTSAMKTVANGAVLILTLLMAAGVGQNLRRQGFFDWVHQKYERVSSGVRKSNKVSIADPSVIVCKPANASDETSVDEEAEHVRHGHEPLPIIIDSGESADMVLHYDNEGDDASVGEEEDECIPFRVVIWMVVTRMLIVSAAEFALVNFVSSKLFKGPDARLAQLTLSLQSVTPATNLSILLCQKAGRWTSVHALAQSILLQYIVSMLTLTIYTALALGVYE